MIVINIPLMPSPDEKFMAAAIVPGPPRIGIASGVTAILNAPCMFPVPAAAIAGLCTFDCCPCNICRPIMNTRIPPVIWNAGKVMPNKLKISLPSRIKKTIRIKVIINALKAMRLLIAVESLAVRPRNTGVLAIGFIMAKKPMNTVKI